MRRYAAEAQSKVEMLNFAKLILHFEMLMLLWEVVNH